MACGVSAAAVVLILLVQNSEAVVNEAELAGLVANILNVYKPTNVNGNPPMFSLAISVPLNTLTNRYDFSQVTAADSALNVRSALDRCQVYEGSRVVASTLLKWPDVKNQCPNSPIPTHWTFVKEACPNARTWAHLGLECTNSINKKHINKKLDRSPNGAVEHAEYRVLQKINTLVSKLNTGPLSRTDLMLFYVYKSPCDSRCSSVSNTLNILTAIRAVTSWQNYAVVFSGIFVPVATSFTPAQLETNRRTSLMNLGNAINGVGNIYRCVERSNRCRTCAGPVGVANACVSDNQVISNSHMGM